jgi:NAD(P)H-flavin reductase
MSATPGTAPLGRREALVSASRGSGGYVIVSVDDATGPAPEPGQFYMLTGAGWGGEDGRPYLPRALSVAATEERPGGGVRLDFLLHAIGPGTALLAAASAGDPIWLTGPLGVPFSAPTGLLEGAQGAILVGGGIGIAPLAMMRRGLVHRGVPTRTLLGFRDAEHSGGLDLFRCTDIGLASEDGHAGHQGYVTDLLEAALAGDDAGSGVVYSCGPPAMLEAVRRMCLDRGVIAELALESPMGCGFGACFGCAVPLAEGGYMRLCVDGPVVRADRVATAHTTGPLARAAVAG